MNEKKPFDYKKDKEFEEKTNKLHFPNVQKFIKGDDWFTYLTEIADLSRWMPSRSIMLARDCTVKTVPDLSPVPFNPTTRP